MRHSLYVFLLVTLVACSSALDDKKNYTADELYSLGMESMQDHNFEKAVKTFEKLQSRFPYGRYAQQAQMEIAYAYYKQGEPAPSLGAIDRFIKQYPKNTHLDYMYYLKGLNDFDENLVSIMNALSGQDPAERDPKSLHESFETFKELVTRFPNSPYAADARLRMQFLLNTLAGSDIHVASYYLRRGAYVAALNRAKDVLTNYPNTPQVHDALQIMVQAYDALGMRDLSNDTQRILKLNIASNETAPIAKESPKNNHSWWKFWN